MNVKELNAALAGMIEDGHGDAEVSTVNGTGKVVRVMGWELAINGRYEPTRGVEQQPPKKSLRFYMTARF